MPCVPSRVKREITQAGSQNWDPAFFGVSGMARSVIDVCNRGAKAIREVTGRMKVPARALMTGTSS